MTESRARASAPVVWLLKDEKPGHRNQLKGLGNRLRVLAGADVHDIDTSQTPVSLWRALLGIAPDFNKPTGRPNLIIGAGHGSHRLLLALRRWKKTRTVVLMKPGFPQTWVDAVIAPAHDEISPAKHVLATEGVINGITPLARITDKPEALILIGGPSRHYQWDDDAILGQLTDLIGRYRDWRWTISGSRRTPSSLQKHLEELASLKVSVADPERTHDNWLSHQLAASRAIWVTPDSGSMVCEAITSGVPTGLFDLPAVPDSRVAKGIERLLDQGYVVPWSDHAALVADKRAPAKPLWEADRVARWLIHNRFLGRHS